MKKLISLIKASMTQNMSLFKIKTKKQTQLSKITIPLFLAVALFISIASYANMLIEPLAEVNLEFVVLTLFICITSIMTLTEGIYKSSNLLFNCKDDNLLLSLPIKKSTVLFVRILKFYLFELLFNSLFLLPAMWVYTRYVSVGIMYYIISFFALIMLPIIPIVISSVIGGIISFSSSKFKLKNIAQIIITTIMLLIMFYVSLNLKEIITKIAENASNINELITKIYYPAGAYIKLITNFNIGDLVTFVFINISILIATIIILSNVYFKINSNIKVVKTLSKNEGYKIKTNKPMKSLIKKELSKFISSPVFVTNTAFGLVLFIVGCIAITLKFENIIGMITMQYSDINIEQVKSYIPVILFGLVCFASLMSSITSSMISLEGKSFNILKSLPVKPSTVIISKVLTAVLIMIPFLFIGDLIIFIKFEFTILQIILILISSVILPLVAETIGIVVNLKYPKMDAENDTQVVKQSMSSTVAVFLGMILVVITAYVLVKCFRYNISVNIIIFSGVGIYSIILIGLLIYLNKRSVEEFNSINV